MVHTPPGYLGTDRAERARDPRKGCKFYFNLHFKRFKLGY
jgi:hypothetical protein